MNRGRLSGDRTSANGRRSLFFPSFVSSFAFLSRVRDLETADRVRCNYPPSGRRGRSVPWSVRSFVRPGLCREVNASRVCSPIGRQRAGGEHSVHSSSDSHTAFPIPRADGHRQSETSHEILHGENLRVPAAFPLIRTRGNRPFRSRGERGPRATRCNNIVVVCIDSFTLFSPFFIPSSSRAPFPPVLVRFMRFSRFFHTTRLLCHSHPFALPLSLLTLSLSLSLPLCLSFSPASVSVDTIIPYVQHATVIRRADTRSFGIRRADHSLLSCGSARFPHPNHFVYIRARRTVVHSYERIRLSPRSDRLGSTYVPCTEENVFTSPLRTLDRGNIYIYLDAEVG